MTDSLDNIIIKHMRMKNLTKYTILVILVMALGCTKEPETKHNLMALDEEAVAPTEEQKISETVERKLIKEGSVDFETDNLSTARKNIFEAVRKYKGYVSSDREFKSTDRISNTVIIRVPSEDFDNLLKDAIRGVDRIDSKEINVIDITEEFLDIHARLKTKKQLENRFLELLKQAKNVTEIVEIEKQIGQLRSDIESIEGRLNYIQDRVSLSTLTITFYQNLPYKADFGQKFITGFKSGWDNLIWFFVGLINIWPFILIGLGLIIGLSVYRRRNSMQKTFHQ
jgi:hypothetical protein